MKQEGRNLRNGIQHETGCTLVSKECIRELVLDMVLDI